MFELEIMATGYAIVVASITTVVCKLLSRKKLNQMREELNKSQVSLAVAETEIKALKITLGEQSKKSRSLG